jgi:hypothetical protein
VTGLDASETSYSNSFCSFKWRIKSAYVLKEYHHLCGHSGESKMEGEGVYLSVQ